jgi:hypothetical protein
MVDTVHKVDLSHNSDKSEWFVTVSGDFYTEFTFYNQQKAESAYEILTSSFNIFMDSLVIANKRSILGMTEKELLAHAEDT